MELSSHTEFEPVYGISLKKLQALVFLLIWPGINLTFVLAVLFDLRRLDLQLFWPFAVSVWSNFFFAFLAFQLIERYLPKVARTECFVCQLLLHIGVIVGVGIINTPTFPFDPSTVQARVLESTPIVPRFIVILEIAVYLAVRRMLIQNSKSYASALALRESELAVVRSQGNPHFMFNTLNLINAEISDDPENAKEILFDLADLLRKSLRLSQHTFTTVSDEAELARLYFTLQKKRFKRRLTFDIDIDEAVRDMRCPALLLQPVIENAVKHAVAPYAAPAHISLQATLQDHRLALIVKDTGPPFDESKVADGNGMRIVRKTLDLHYAGHYEMQLASRESGGEFSIRIPARASGVSNGRT